MTGSLSVLNVGAGDIELKFNHHNRAERDVAIRMLNGMIQRGYAILVKLDDGSYTRAIEVDATRGTYIIQEPDSDVVIDVGLEQKALPAASDAIDDGPALPTKKRRGRPPGRRHIPIERAHAVGVARSAGG